MEDRNQLNFPALESPSGFQRLAKNCSLNKIPTFLCILAVTILNWLCYIEDHFSYILWCLQERMRPITTRSNTAKRVRNLASKGTATYAIL